MEAAATDGVAEPSSGSDGARGSNPNAGATEADDATFVVAVVDGDRYLIDVLQVQEIVSDVGVTRVPGAPPAIRGVTNVRGRVLAVVDLAIALVEADGAGGSSSDLILVLDSTVGTDLSVAVDDVIDVAEVAGESLQPPPPFGLGGAAPYAVAVTELADGELAVVLDLSILVGDPDVAAPAEAGAVSGAASSGELPR